MEKVKFSTLATNYKVVFLDSYGVLKNHAGLIDGVSETLEFLRGQGIVTKVLTNDASRSRQQQVDLFKRLGLNGLTVNDIITSGTLARLFLEDKKITGKIGYLGTVNAANYILHIDRDSVPISEIDLEDCDDISAFVFLDDEGFDWNVDINKTINLLRMKNIPVVVANSDKLYPVSPRDVAVGTGGIAKLVENILNRKFIHFGKPDSQMFMFAYNQILKEGDFSKHEILMVGDTLTTDILGGNKFGLDTALVLTGNTIESSVDTLVAATGILPDYICRSIMD
ncbi:MAG: haloacid dehalogenase [Cyclobacteriaceae bacterium]|nr:MAG: haloacid dehalogenase [Cyclobacteriaceae bacterium]